MPTFEITDPESGKIVEITGDSPPTEAELEQIFAGVQNGVSTTATANGDGSLQSGNQADRLISDPVNLDLARKAALEVIAGFNRGALSVADIPADIANAALQLAGSDLRVPTLKGSAIGKAGAGGGFVQDPNLRQALGLLGEFTTPAAPIGVAAKTGATGAVDDIARSFTAQSPAKQKIAETLAADPANKKLAEFIRDETGKVAKSPQAMETLRQGFDRGVIAATKAATKRDKRKMQGMVDILKRGRENALFASKNRPSDIAGQTLLERVNHIKKVNKEAGAAVNKAAQDLKGKQADFSPAVDDFLGQLDEMGITVERLDNGNFKAAFEGSDIEGVKGAEKAIKNVLGRISKLTPKPSVSQAVSLDIPNQSIDGLSSRQMKSIIDYVESPDINEFLATGRKLPDHLKNQFDDIVKAINDKGITLDRPTKVYRGAANPETGKTITSVTPDPEVAARFSSNVEEVVLPKGTKILPMGDEFVHPSLIGWDPEERIMEFILKPGDFKKGTKTATATSELVGMGGLQRQVLSEFEPVRTAKRLPDAFEGHRLKKFIDEQVTFGKQVRGLSGKSERVLKQLRTGLDNVLDANFADYEKANTTFSETINALDSLQASAGTKLDFFGPNADKAVGTSLRRLLSNTQSRANMVSAIDEIEKVAKKTGGKFEDDITTQVLFADELDRMFGAAARTSFKGQIEQAVRTGAEVAQDQGITERAVGAAGEALERARGINEDAAIKSIEELLKTR